MTTAKMYWFWWYVGQHNNTVKAKTLKNKPTLVHKALVPPRPPAAPQCHTQIIIASHLNAFGMAMLCMSKPDTLFFYLVVSTHLKNASQNENLPQVRVKIKHIWNHQPVLCVYDMICQERVSAHLASVNLESGSCVCQWPRSWRSVCQ